MCEHTFMGIVAAHYMDIKKLFKSRLYNIDLQFDEDIFSDTFIKCATKFDNDIVSYDTAVKYFWTAYLNNVKLSKINTTKIDFVELDENLHDCIDDVYNELYDDDYTINIYNIVMNAITVKYGRDLMEIYSLHKFHGWSKDDLIDAGYDCDNFETNIKEIHKFVKSYGKRHIK